MLLLTLAFIPVYLSLSPSESFIPCSFRLGSGARWLGFSNQTPTAHVGTLARRGTMGAVSPLRHPAEPRTSWLTSSWSRTGVAEMRNLPQNDSSVSRQLASLGETGAVASAPHSYWRLTSSLSGTGVVVREYPELNANFSSFPTTVLLLSNFRKVLQEMTNSQATVESELVTLATLKTPVEQSCKSNIPACRETLTFGIQ